jgi:proteasome lid subunit RPN8/RPN11
MYVSLNQPHPQEFVDAIYSEIIDQHDDAEEVDIIVQIDTGVATREDADESDGFTVIDYRTFRVDEEWLGDTPEDADDNQRLKEMDAWGRSAGTAYIYIHSHPEGYPFPSDKDVRVAQRLTTIDFARTPPNVSDNDLSLRTFVLAVVINRDASCPIPISDLPLPIFDREIDTAVEVRVWAELEHSHGDHPRWPVVSALRQEWIALIAEQFDARESGDQAAFEALKPRALAIMAQMQPIMDEMDGRSSLPPEVVEMLRLLGDVRTLRDTLAGQTPFAAPDTGTNDSMNAGLAAMRDAIAKGRKDEPLSPDSSFPNAGNPDIPDVFRWVD